MASRWMKKKVTSEVTGEQVSNFTLTLIRNFYGTIQIEVSLDEESDPAVWFASLFIWSHGEGNTEFELPVEFKTARDAKLAAVREARLFFQDLIEKLPDKRSGNSPKSIHSLRSRNNVLEREEYGPVVIVKGGLAGHLAYYDDDETNGAIVYLNPAGIKGVSKTKEGYYLLPWSWLRRLDAQQAAQWLQRHIIAERGRERPKLVTASPSKRK